jgi:hypothetical protein
MLLLPIAAFLTGSLLTLLLPVGLLIAISVWYWVYVARVPGPGEPPDAGIPPTAAPGAPADRDPSKPPSAT